MIYCPNRTFLREKGDADWPRCRDKRHKLGLSRLKGYAVPPVCSSLEDSVCSLGDSLDRPRPEGCCFTSRDHEIGAGSRLQTPVSPFVWAGQPCALASCIRRAPDGRQGTPHVPTFVEHPLPGSWPPLLLHVSFPLSSSSSFLPSLNSLPNSWLHLRHYRERTEGKGQRGARVVSPPPQGRRVQRGPMSSSVGGRIHVPQRKDTGVSCT